MSNNNWANLAFFMLIFVTIVLIYGVHSVLVTIIYDGYLCWGLSIVMGIFIKIVDLGSILVYNKISKG